MNSVKITYIGHSTAMIQAGKTSILTDPIFSDNVLVVKRANKPGIKPGDLPELSAVLISHTHLDHLDMPSFNYIRTSVPIVVPEGSGKSLVKNFPNPIIELAGWASHNFTEGFKIHAVPVNHPSCVIFPRGYRMACSYIIEVGGKTIFFAGDTAYHSEFRNIGNTYNVDVAMLPIGCYKPTFYMKRYHMDPADAVQAFLDLKAKVMIPIHWGTFRLSLEKLEEPIEWLKKIASERSIKDQIKILKPGEHIDI